MGPIAIQCNLIQQNSFFNGHWRSVLEYIFPKLSIQDEARITNPIYNTVVNVDNPSIRLSVPSLSGHILLHFRRK